MSDKRFVMHCLALAFVVLAGWYDYLAAQEPSTQPQPPTQPEPSGQRTAPPESHEAAWREAMDSVTVKELNSVHSEMLERIIYRMSGKAHISLSNEGAVSRRGPLRIFTNGIVETFGRRIEGGDIGRPLHWNIVNDENRRVLLTFWVSLRKTDETVTELPGTGRLLYVNVQGATKDSLAKAREELGGKSINDLVELLNTPVQPR